MKILNLISVFILLSAIAFSQETKLSSSVGEPIQEVMIPKEVKSSLNNFFEEIEDGNVKEAFDDFLKDSPIKNNTEDVNSLINQTERSIKIYGKFNESEFVNGHFASKSYIRLRYLGLYDKYPMRWIFTFYNSPKMGWIVTNIKLDDLSEFYLGD